MALIVDFDFEFHQKDAKTVFLKQFIWCNKNIMNQVT